MSAHPAGKTAFTSCGTCPVLPVFKLMQEIGHVADAEMYRTFNMGVGMIIHRRP